MLAYLFAEYFLLLVYHMRSKWRVIALFKKGKIMLQMLLIGYIVSLFFNGGKDKDRYSDGYDDGYSDRDSYDSDCRDDWSD